MKIKDLVSFPFDGLFCIYAKNERGLIEKVAYGFSENDIPEKLYEREIKAIYPANDSINIDII